MERWRWVEGVALDLAMDEIGEKYGRYRLHTPEAERAMARSLERFGQMSPIVVCVREERHELIDGFKRLAAVRSAPQRGRLRARVIDADEQTVKAAIFGLNHVGVRTNELEEAWIVHALVREDGLTQVEVADLLSKHKSWVCRRLQLIEKLVTEAKDDLRLGLLRPTAARELIKLPHGNQCQVLSAIRREGLSTAEVGAVVEMLVSSANQSQVEFVLSRPREAIAQKNEIPIPARDPRLSDAGNRLLKRLCMLLDLLARMENWLKHPGRAELSPQDREILGPSFTKLGREARAVAEFAEDAAIESLVA